jgi:hypothetical protein
MRLTALQQLSGRQGPFVSVSMDVTRGDEVAARELETRWRDLERGLKESGAPAGLLKSIGDALLEPTGQAGHVGRLVIADASEIVVDLVLPRRPVTEEALFGPAPLVLPAFRALSDRLPYLLAEVDRTGADITVVGPLGTPSDHLQVQGSHDVIHRVAGGQLSQRRIQARAEDSWAGNAAEVAKELETLIAQHHPAVVLLDGDVVAVTDVLSAAGGRLKELAVRLKSGSRADGASRTARDVQIEAVIVGQQRADHAALLDRFGTEEGRQQAAVQGLEDAVDAARRAQVQELFLHDDPASTRTVWMGSQPVEIGVTSDDVRTMGATDPVRVRADTALVWAVLSTDAGLTLLDPDERTLSDGIGALLRWSDRSTPHDAIPSMPGHGAELGSHHREG